MMPLSSLVRRLRRSTSGVAMIEFAVTMPFFLTAGLWGVETANLALMNMRVGQMAIHLADNASRVGDTSTLSDRKVYEADINDTFLGSNLQAGQRLDFYRFGRAVISSLEVDSATGYQYIHWQRCKGSKNFASQYGGEGTGLDGSLSGMGPAGEEVTAIPGDAVIYVEVSYTYQPLIDDFFAADSQINSTAAFTVRDSRDLTQLYQRDDALPDPVSDCNTFDNFG